MADDLDAYTRDLPSDPLERIERITEDFQEIKGKARGYADETAGVTPDKDFYDEYLRQYAISQAALRGTAFEMDDYTLDLEFHDNLIHNMQSFERYFDKLYDLVKVHKGRARLNQYTEQAAANFGKGFYYEFTEDEVDKIQTTINELRYLISASDLFEDEHKQRLLRRLERLQSELHKKVSDLDRFWGLAGDLGVALGKFGNYILEKSRCPPHLQIDRPVQNCPSNRLLRGSRRMRCGMRGVGRITTLLLIL